MSEREWHFYLDDMIDFAEKVLANTEGLVSLIFENEGRHSQPANLVLNSAQSGQN